MNLRVFFPKFPIWLPLKLGKKKVWQKSNSLGRPVRLIRVPRGRENLQIF